MGGGVISQNFVRKLNEYEKRFIRVPRDVVRCQEVRTTITFLFFSIRRGMDDRVIFTINQLVKWCGYTPDRHKGRTNEKFFNAVKILIEMGYIEPESDIDAIGFGSLEQITVRVNQANIDAHIEEFKSQNVDGLFATVYLDEIQSLLSYSSERLNIASAPSSAALILVFAYLRSMIYLRNDTLSDGFPESHYDYYFNIVKKIPVSSRVLSKSVNILCYDLNLIYFRHTKIKLSNGTWATLQTIFCNTYVRQRGKLIAYGSDYYLNEIKKTNLRKKKIEIEQMNQKMYIGLNRKSIKEKKCYHEIDESEWMSII